MDPNHLTLPQRAGQRMMVGFDGTRLDDTLKSYIDRLAVGGLILFARNIQSPRQTARLCRQAQDCAAASGHPPLLIAVDQEGGVVSRLKPPFLQFAGQPRLKSDIDAIHFARSIAGELKHIGINMNMAPVLDVLPPTGPSVMQDRAFRGNWQEVAQLGTWIIDTFQRNRIMAVAKHFPGIGRTVLDSHHELPDLESAADSLYDTDIKPFERAAASGVAGIMLSHIRYRSFDSRWPASLSPAIVDDILRRRLGYGGVVLTDDLDMGAIAKHYPLPTVVTQCLAASVDILLICHPGDKIETAHALLREQLQRDASAADAALRRIMDLKAAYLP